MSLLDGVEGFARAFNVILGERCTVTSKSQNGCSGIWGTVNNVCLAGLTDVGENQIEDCNTNTWMRVIDLSRPKVKDLACPW